MQFRRSTSTFWLRTLTVRLHPRWWVSHSSVLLQSPQLSTTLPQRRCTLLPHQTSPPPSIPSSGLAASIHFPTHSLTPTITPLPQPLSHSLPASGTQPKPHRQSPSCQTLFLDIGYKDSSATPSTNSSQLSPNTQGFLLEALFLAHLNQVVSADVVVPAITNLLDVFWPKMLNQNQYFTGATCRWECLHPNGSPGIGLFTSLSHPWGSAPTYVLTDYVLGVRPLAPGYET